MLQVLYRLKPHYLLFLGMLILAIHPLQWLVTTWMSPAYQSDGGYVILLIAGLLLWSFSNTETARPVEELSRKRLALGLLLLSTLVRLIGQLLGVNTISAVVLVVDVYALALLFGLEQRSRALSPFWLAVLFAFSLPLEHVFQRLIGYALQQLSAAGACQVLSWGADPVVCEGVNILLAGQSVLVDLPCSGARGLLQLCLLFAALAAVLRPAWSQAILGCLLTLLAAYLSNVLRIVLLALGIAYPNLWHVDVMASPYHDLIGLLALGLGLIPVLIWAVLLPKPAPSGSAPYQEPRPAQTYRYSLLPAAVFTGLAVVITQLPVHPVDVSRPLSSANQSLPHYLHAYTAQMQPLNPQEQDYFVRYGGAASKAQYGPFGLMKVSSSAPLRHLHTPEACLRGAGHEVQYVTQSQQDFPTAFYHSTDPQGQAWQIRVTFVAEDGRLSTNISEVIWHWLQRRDVAWSMLQRIAPAELSAAEFDTWDQTLRIALEL